MYLRIEPDSWYCEVNESSNVQETCLFIFLTSLEVIFRNLRHAKFQLHLSSFIEFPILRKTFQLEKFLTW